MNMIELDCHLNALTMQSFPMTKTAPKTALEGVKDAIVRVWAGNPYFTDENAVETMKYFLNTGILNF